ncbi:uncharacterized protein LOC110695839 [Chenopodium quinoa]|uniref:uncharacterized protein LOC110695839 n=1 Tax=Chenopodium quinoa TaxID=63459 RepID=UPI000B795175|nr:uncharacterized protein LOC110695839 [Chenopodium quinoa]
MVDGNNDTPPPPPPPSSPAFHPAYAVSNIKNLMPITLDQEESQYATWVELFRIHACAFNVLDHIDTTVDRPSDIDDFTWKRLDAIVKQWIYGTISKDLVNTIMKPGATALVLWKRLEELFYDNKHTRAVYLEEQFNTIRLENFANMSEYTRQIKLLADQLSNVGNPVSESKMILQLITGLPKGEYDTVAAMIQQTDPLPSFNSARSRFLLEETRKSKQEEHSQHALVAQSPTGNSSASPQTTIEPQRTSGGRGGGSNSRGRGRGNLRGGKIRGGSVRGKPQSATQHQQQHGFNQPPNPTWANQQQAQPHQQWAGPVQGGWASPPCPYPTQPTAFFQRPQGSILGPRPAQQAYFAPVQQQQGYGPLMYPTELGKAYSSMSLQPPNDGWYMYTGATSHLTHNAGNLPQLFSLSTPQFILVGNGKRIPIQGYGHTSTPPPQTPFQLKNVLYAPNIIKNLISVRKFTCDNSVSIEFYPFGFSVKDLHSGTVLARCNSVGDLYPFSSSSAAREHDHISFTAISPSTWHNRLGHPGAPVFNFLRNNNFINCNKGNNAHFCYSCPLGKLARLPFSVFFE